MGREKESEANQTERERKVMNRMKWKLTKREKIERERGEERKREGG